MAAAACLCFGVMQCTVRVYVYRGLADERLFYIPRIFLFGLAAVCIMVCQRPGKSIMLQLK